MEGKEFNLLNDSIKELRSKVDEIAETVSKMEGKLSTICSEFNDVKNRLNKLQGEALVLDERVDTLSKRTNGVERQMEKGQDWKADFTKLFLIAILSSTMTVVGSYLISHLS